MQTFYKLLAIVLLVGTTNNFVWFALTFWAYLTTHSVVSTGIVGGLFALSNALSSFWIGSIVDHFKKKQAMVGSSIVTLLFFGIGYLIFVNSPSGVFDSVASPYFWMFAITLMLGVIAGSIYYIAVPTLITILVPEERRDKANGMFGTVTGIGFAITSVASGFVLAFGGMQMVLKIAVGMTILAIAIWSAIPIPEKEVIHVGGEQAGDKKVDIKGTIKIIRSIPGMFALIFFTTFNNFIGGVFMALMDAYGLTLVSVQTTQNYW